jgi:hypothetical protein
MNILDYQKKQQVAFVHDVQAGFNAGQARDANGRWAGGAGQDYSQGTDTGLRSIATAHNRAVNQGAVPGHKNLLHPNDQYTLQKELTKRGVKVAVKKDVANSYATKGAIQKTISRLRKANLAGPQGAIYRALDKRERAFARETNQLNQERLLKGKT